MVHLIKAFDFLNIYQGVTILSSVNIENGCKILINPIMFKSVKNHLNLTEAVFYFSLQIQGYSSVRKFNS